MSRLVYLSAIGFASLVLAGCTVPLTNGAPEAVDVQKAYPIVVEPQVATLVVQVDEGLQTLARGEDVRVRAFVDKWRARGKGMLNAAAPSGAMGAIALEQLKKVLAANGATGDAVQFTSYRPTDDNAPAPITLSFVTYVATAAECGQDWSKNLGYTPRNQPWPEFGCSTQHNLAAIVRDPRDLIEPQASDPVDAERRGTVFEKYRAGQPTQTTDTTDQDSGQVSTVGQ